MDTERFKSLLSKVFKQYGFSLTSSQISLFTTYWADLKLWNTKINLTSIRDDHEVIMKHFLDSVDVLNYFIVQENDLVVDVGSGAGFPGIPIKILMPSLDLTLVESISKKTSFLKFLKTLFQGRCYPQVDISKNQNIQLAIFAFNYAQ